MAERIQPAKELTAQEILGFVNGIPTIQTITNNVDTKIGANNTPASNALTANQSAKINWLLANLNILVTGRVVKSVQRGRAAITTPSITTSVTVSPVVTTKAFLVVESPAYLGLNGIGGNLNAVAYHSYGVLTSSTRLDLYMQGTVTTDSSYAYGINWQLIEFY